MVTARADIQSFLDRKGLTQQGLASLIGVKRSRVAQWNRGGQDITRADCGKLLLAGMTIEELFGTDVAETVKKDLQSKNIDVSMLSDEACRQIVLKGYESLKI